MIATFLALQPTNNLDNVEATSLQEYKESFVYTMSRSLQAFETVIKPELIKVMGGDFIAIEGLGKEMVSLRQALDRGAGIDLLYIRPNKLGVDGVANRVQFGLKSFDSFTIRAQRDGQPEANTELAKRKLALEKGYLCPGLTIQSYISEATGHLIAAAVVRTSVLIESIDQGKGKLLHTGYGRVGQSSFYSVEWAELAGKVLIIRPDNTLLEEKKEATINNG